MSKLTKIKRHILTALLCAMFLLLPLSAQAKVTVLEDTPLKNVTNAKRVEGRWVEKGTHFRFRLSNGNYKKGGWFRKNDKIFYVNSKGNRVSGWVKYRDNLYYLKPNGALKTGWLSLDQKRYYLKENGCLALGWFSEAGHTYYFNPSTGAAATGWVRFENGAYYFSEKTSQLQKNTWILTNGKYYYVDKHGRKATSGWKKINGKIYYLDANGARMTGTLYFDYKGYYFGKDGAYDPSVKVEPMINPNKPMVALTFDDGPGRYTGRLLDCLEKNEAKATFFLVGSSVPNYKSTVKRMADMGCELGGHSYNHSSYTSLSSSAIVSDVSKTVANIKSAAGQGPTVFRLPYGNGHATGRVLSSLGLPSIFWSIDTMDWANTGNPSHTVNAVLNHVQNGSIVLMHDIHYSTIVAAEKIIPELKKRGYQLVTVSQLAKYKGKTTLQKGKTYYHF